MHDSLPGSMATDQIVSSNLILLNPENEIGVNLSSHTLLEILFK